MAEEVKETKAEDVNEEKETKKGKKTVLFAIIAAVAIIAVLVSVVMLFGPKTTKGAKSITVTVTDNEGVDTVYESNTDAEVLYDALMEIEELTVEGSESEYGFFIETVNGVTADFNVDQSYWAIYVNGEYGQYGISEQPVNDGDSFAIIYEISTY